MVTALDAAIKGTAEVGTTLAALLTGIWEHSCKVRGKWLRPFVDLQPFDHMGMAPRQVQSEPLPPLMK